MINIAMKKYMEDDSGIRFRMRLVSALEKEKEIVLDFTDSDGFELLILKELLRTHCRFRDKGTVIKIKNAPESFETILLMLNTMKEYLVLV